MSLFKTKAIILKISKIKEKDFIFDIFTFDYGKIKVQKKDSKKEKSLDLGYIINCEIETKEWRDMHKIKNIKIKSEFRYEHLWFSTINLYLNIIWIIYQKIPFWVEFKDLFEVIEEVNSKKNIEKIKLVLSKLKVIDLLWELKIDNDDEIIRKILKFINKNKIKDIFKLNWLEESTISKLESI